MGDRVVVLDDLSTGNTSNLEDVKDHPFLTIRSGSVLDEALLRELVGSADRVFHLAAAVGVKLIVRDPIKVIRSNVTGTERILESCAEFGCPVLLASSSEVYGKSETLPFTEGADMIFGPTERSRWSYAASKAVGEFLAFAYRKASGLPVVVARFFNTTGKRQSGQYGMVLPRFVLQAVADEPITVYGDGEQSRCFAYVGDVVGAAIKLLETPQAYGEVVNLGSEESTTIRGLAELVKKMAGSASEIVHIPFEEAYEPGFEDMPVRRPDLSKARRLIGYEPRLSLREIVAEVIAFTRKEGSDE
jgi:UDP-glucose 4-epimerase